MGHVPAPRARRNQRFVPSCVLLQSFCFILVSCPLFPPRCCINLRKILFFLITRTGARSQIASAAEEGTRPLEGDGNCPSLAGRYIRDLLFKFLVCVSQVLCLNDCKSVKGNVCASPMWPVSSPSVHIHGVGLGGRVEFVSHSEGLQQLLMYRFSLSNLASYRPLRLFLTRTLGESLFAISYRS